MAVLRHPENGSELVQDGTRLLARDSPASFPIYAGIPSLVYRPPARHLFWQWVYNRLAFGYDLGVRWGWGLSLGGKPIDRRSYLALVDVRPGDRVMETAVGTGANVSLLPESGRYFGVDLSLNMLQRCRINLAARKRQAHLVHADMQALPFKDGVFDVVYHMGGLQFASKPGRVLQEMLRTARPGATVTVVDENDSLPRILRRARKSAVKHLDAGLDGLLELVPVDGALKSGGRINDGELFHIQFQKPQ